MTNKIDIFTIDLKALTDRYKAYCAEQGIGPGVWRYRYLFGLPMALAIAVLTFALYAYWDSFHPARSLRPAPAFHAGIAFVMAYLLFTSGTLGLYLRHCTGVLIRAGIEIPTVLPAPSIVETFRKRREIRRQNELYRVRHGLRSYAHWWTAAQLGGSLLIFFLFAFPTVYLMWRGLPNSTDLSSSVVIFVLLSLMWCAYLEAIYLDLCWKRVNRHDPCSSCAPSC